MRSVVRVVATAADVYWGVPKPPFKLSRNKNENKIVNEIHQMTSEGGRSTKIRSEEKDQSSETNSSTAS